MTDKEFIKLYSGYFGEEVDNIKQIVTHTFTGEELFEFIGSINATLTKERDDLQKEVLQQHKDLLNYAINVCPDLDATIDRLTKERDELREALKSLVLESRKLQQHTEDARFIDWEDEGIEGCKTFELAMFKAKELLKEEQQ